MKHVHCRICGREIERKTPQIYEEYECEACKKNLEKAQELYEEFKEEANCANHNDYPDWKMEVEMSEKIHGKGCSHPLIEHIYTDKIIAKKIEEIKNKTIRRMVGQLLADKQEMVSNAWR